MSRSRFTLEFDTDNDAFTIASVSQTMAQVLRETARKIEAGRIEGPIIDLNGNSVGRFQLEAAQ